MIQELHQSLHAFFPVVPAVLLAAQLGKGLLDNAKAKRENARADALNGAIPQVDPGIQAQLSAFQLKQRYAENGASRPLAYKKGMIEDAGEQTRSNLLRGAGTSPGMLQQGLLRSQDRTQDALTAAGAQSEGLGMQYEQMQTPLISDIADRTLSLQEYLRDKQNFQATQDQQNANNAITGALGAASAFGLKNTYRTDDTDGFGQRYFDPNANY
jgi:hypothetical protein